MNYCETKEDFIKYAEQLYERHVQAKAGGLSEPICATELLAMKFPLEHVADGEVDYRRGFTHGFAYAVDLIYLMQGQGYRRPVAIGEILDRFFDAELMSWRYQARTDAASGDRCKFTEGHPHLKITKPGRKSA